MIKTKRILPLNPGQKPNSSLASSSSSSRYKNSSRGARIERQNNNNIVSKLSKLEEIIDYHFIPNAADGNCFYYSIYDSMIHLSELLDINILLFVKDCLDHLDHFIDISTQETFNKTIRECLAYHIKQNILSDLAKYDYESTLYNTDENLKDIYATNNKNNRKKRLNTYNKTLDQYESMNEDMKKIILQDDILYYKLLNYNDEMYKELLKDNFNHILGLANSKTTFLEIFPSEMSFNNNISEFTERNFTYANNIHISILNLLLGKCKLNDFKFEIIPFTSNISNIFNIIKFNYEKKIITIPISKKSFEHYEGIMLHRG